MSILQRVYDATLRPRLPRKWGLYNGVPARSPRLLDTTDTKPDYKQGLKDAIQDHVSTGDAVDLVGGGRGVSSVWCARQGAAVDAYEAATEMVAVARDTIARQGLSGQAIVHHALVGEAIDVFGSAADAERIHPADIGGCDVLVMDCEGAEASILEGLETWPETVIVETHPELGVAPTDSAAQLSEAGYAIDSYEYEPGRPEKPVLVGTGGGR